MTDKHVDYAFDFLGQRIDVGDSVVFVQREYRNFMIGIIKRITPKTLLISHDRTNVGQEETRQFHNQVIRIRSHKDQEGELE